MSARTAALALLALLGGCAGMSENECRTTNWYDRGKLDGEVYGLQPQNEIYASRCAAFGLKPDDAQYLVGWRDGWMEWRSRTDKGGGPD